jgi:hypothetical protein
MTATYDDPKKHTFLEPEEETLLKVVMDAQGEGAATPADFYLLRYGDSCCMKHPGLPGGSVDFDPDVVQALADAQLVALRIWSPEAGEGVLVVTIEGHNYYAAMQARDGAGAASMQRAVSSVLQPALSRGQGFPATYPRAAEAWGEAEMLAWGAVAKPAYDEVQRLCREAVVAFVAGVGGATPAQPTDGALDESLATMRAAISRMTGLAEDERNMLLGLVDDYEDMDSRPLRQHRATLQPRRRAVAVGASRLTYAAGQMLTEAASRFPPPPNT